MVKQVSYLLRMVYVYTAVGTFLAKLGGDMGGLGSPCRMVWNGSTEADLGIFHAHSKPF